MRPNFDRDEPVAALEPATRAMLRRLAKRSIEELGVDPTPRLVTLKVEEPAKRQGGVKVGSVVELVDKLKNEARVI